MGGRSGSCNNKCSHFHGGCHFGSRSQPDFVFSAALGIGFDVPVRLGACTEKAVFERVAETVKVGEDALLPGGTAKVVLGWGAAWKATGVLKTAA